MRSLPRPLVAVVLLLGLALLVSGCGEGTRNTAPSPITQDTADDVAINTVAALGILGGDVEGSISASSGLSPQFGPARVRSVQTDTTFVRDSITFHVQRTFYDALNQPLPAFGPTAARLVWVSDASGHFTGPRDTASVGHHAALTVTGNGLLAVADTLILNGASNDTLTNAFRSYDGNTTRFFHWVSALVIADVQWAKGAPYPASGTLTFTATADRIRSRNDNTIESHHTVTVVITFDGTIIANVLVNGTYAYHWNILTGVVTRA